MNLEQHIRRHVTGEPVPVDLGDGDSITLHLTQAQEAYVARAVELEFEALKEVGAGVEPAPEGEEQPKLKLTSAQQKGVLTEALIGTVLVGWDDDGLVVAGRPFAARDEKGELHKEHARTLLRVPDIALQVMRHLGLGLEATRAEVARGKGQRSKRSSGA